MVCLSNSLALWEGIRASSGGSHIATYDSITTKARLTAFSRYLSSELDDERLLQPDRPN